MLTAIITLSGLVAAIHAEPCAGRTSCTVEKRTAAGPAGEVVRLGLGRAGEGAGECELREYWLRGAGLPRLLLRLCNDGYGAAGVGENQVTVTPNVLTVDKGGGSAWRWGQSVTLQLSPLRVLAESGDGRWASGANFEHSEWDWREWTGRVTWYSPPCKGPEPDGMDVPDSMAHAFVPIPQVDVDRDVKIAGWRGARLGACAARLDAAGNGGFIIHGEPGAAEDARMSVVLLGPDTLLVEVRDDRVVTGAKSWIHDDHVELWTGPAAGYMDHCLEKGAATQWGVRVADGAVFSGHGDSAPITAERVEQDGAVRLLITLPEPAQGVTVVYSDSDTEPGDKPTQERLIATSKLRFGDTSTFGRARVINAKHARCVIQSGALEPTETRAFPLDQPALGSLSDSPP